MLNPAFNMIRFITISDLELRIEKKVWSDIKGFKGVK